ncbi:hypothetical protein [Lutibaculum baratangense]|uniref:Uncharacterized protein n=1 Tax=Lutibaculum baratangense AMV1 TaxID=631454 RepID=V4RJE2_9HYPH|nr:hypothetical protein [Lutibaculum baratangense]ESR25434.1 hypothetical protein N177_1729 [Lutibaculum baratangense AMV1]
MAADKNRTIFSSVGIPHGTPETAEQPNGTDTIAPAEKFYLRKNINNARVSEILQYMRDFGHGRTAVEHDRQEVILHVEDLRDAELLKANFRDLIDGEVDLTR